MLTAAVHRVKEKGLNEYPGQHPSRVVSRKRPTDQCLCENTLVRKETAACGYFTFFDAVYPHVTLECEDLATVYLCYGLGYFQQ